MENVLKFKRWHIIEATELGFKILTTDSEAKELAIYFNIHRPKAALFDVVHFETTTVKEVFQLITIEVINEKYNQ